jgi:hypothetical protein
MRGRGRPWMRERERELSRGGEEDEGVEGVDEGGEGEDR